MRLNLLLFCLFLGATLAQSQVIINEGSYKNYKQITDSYDDTPDWIELYNSGNESVNLGQYSLSDNPGLLRKWVFPPTTIQPHQWLVVFASGRNTEGAGVQMWETAVRENDIWNWVNPNANTGNNWMMPGFDDTNWQQGKGGFGFADNDDSTTFSSDKSCVYTRIKFNITDTSSLVAGILHVDYDDGFVAYLNGVEIARANISTQTSWDSFADNATEAIMYQGQNPYAFLLDSKQLDTLWLPGENILAVECHNSSATSSDMSLRVYLSFGLNNTNSQFSSVPEWFSMQTDQGLHTNFKISGKGESIYLSDNNSQVIDSLVLPENMPIDFSFGSITDGSQDRGIFTTATPGSSNGNQTAYTNGYEPEPTVSVAGGIFSGSVSVTLSSTSSTSQIRYTTNGQRPTASSPIYNAPINITTTKVLKAACFSTTNKLPSAIVTNTYMIKIDETPAGILSISMNDEDLYGADGIYDNWSTDWKKPCYIEYYEPDNHKLAFKQNSGIKIDGGAGGSRSNPQRSFRVEPGNGTLGDGDVNYRLIPDKPDRESYEAFYIRNGSNQYLYYPCKDAIETRCMGKGTNNSYAGYTPVNVYLNGQYWGYYELREKIDADFFKQHDGTNEDSLDLLGVSYWYGGQLRGVEGKDPVGQFNRDYEEFLTLDTQADDFWEQADKLFDMEHYVDYICAQSWIADTDWPYNNIKIHRSPETGNRWRFSLVDLEWSLSGGNSWTNSAFNHIAYMLNYDPGCVYIHVWQKAMENQRFRVYFINRFADLMNTSWETNRLKGIANEIYDITRPELPATFERWGNGSVDSYMNQFDNAHTTMLSELTNRSSNVRSHMRNNLNLPKIVGITLNVEPADAGYIKISTIKPDTYPWSGIYFDGVPVRIEAVAKPGYYFDRWDENALLKNASDAVFYDTLTAKATFKAYFIENTQTGLVTISEINYNAESTIDTDDWIELWNFSNTTETNISGWTMTDDDPSHIFTFPENTILEPNKRLVVVRDQDAFEAIYPDVVNLPDLSFGLGNKSDAVKLYDTSLNLVAEVNYADSTPWPLGADGQGRTLELLNPHNPTNDPLNWFDGCIGGSPGTAYLPCDEAVVFSEINFNSAKDFNTNDWVEIRNISNASVNISGWKFMDDADSVTHEFYIPDGTILAPQQNLVLAQDLTTFKALIKNVDNVIGSFAFALNNSGEWIRMYDKSEKLRLSLRYNDKLPWPETADGDGYTAELKDSLGLMNSGSNWFAGCYGGSPGTYFSLPCKTDGVEMLTEQSIPLIYPNPFTHEISIELPSADEVKIDIYQYTGKLVYSTTNHQYLVQLNLNQLPKGLYLLSISKPGERPRTAKIIKQ